MVLNATGNPANCDRIVAVSPQVQAAALQMGASERRVVLIPNGVELPKTATVRSCSDGGNNPLEVIFIGALNHRQKGVKHLPGILKATAASHARIHMTIVGGGEEADWLREECRALGLGPHVTQHGPMPHEAALALLKECDVLIMPSYFEGLPIVLLEAMAHGVVPIASRLRGCTDFVVDSGVNGLLVEPGDEGGFAKAILMLAEDRSQLARFSKEARARAANRFSSDQMVSLYIGEIERCMEERRVSANRTGELDFALLGDLPYLPRGFVRPVRKGLKMLGMWKKEPQRPLLVEVESSQEKGRASCDS